MENTKSKSRTKLFGDEILGGSKADQLGVDKKKISSKKLKSENAEVLDIIKRYYGEWIMKMKSLEEELLKIIYY